MRLTMNAARDTIFPVMMNLEEIRALVQTDLEIRQSRHPRAPEE